MSTSDHNHSPQDNLSIEHTRKSDDSTLYQKAVAIVAQEQAASTSFLQQHLGVGYTEATMLIERLENDGLIGKADGIHKRAIFVSVDAKLDGANYENR